MDRRAPPDAERLSKVFFMLLVAPVRGEIHQSRHTDATVDQKSGGVRPTFAKFALHNVVGGGPQVPKVAKNIADSAANGRWRDRLVGLGDRFDDPLVCLEIDRKRDPVDGFERVRPSRRIRPIRLHLGRGYR